MRILARRLTLVALALAFTGLAVNALAAETPAPAGGKKDDFMPYVQLAPFVVKGKQLTVSVHARSKADRRYAEEFAEEVVKVVYEAVTPETGKGLVIIGKKGEPHPVFVFRKFLALAEAGKLDPEVAARAPELTALLDNWMDTLDGKSPKEGSKSKEKDDEDPEAEQFIEALPIPLGETAGKLYQLAWREEFNEARVEARLKSLKTADLESSQFVRFDWVFYLPPRGSFEKVLNEVIAEELKKEEMGFFTRAVVKGALLAVRGKIRQGIEGMRRGIMFATVVKARCQYSGEEVSALTGAYMETMMPGEKHGEGSEHDRAVQAVKEEAKALQQKAAAAAL